MIIGPICIYKCPSCQHLIKQDSILSGNTFGAKLYSDGKHVAPMLPEFPNLTKCPTCKHLFWLSKQEEYASYTYETGPSAEWVNASDAKFPSIRDYFIALENGLAEDNEEEIDVRMRIWWAYNDRLRKSKNIFKDENDELRWTDNIHKLLLILNVEEDNDKVVAAELHRNLGNFDACIEIINSIKNDDLEWVKEKFLNACKEKNRWVVRMK